MSQFAQPPCDAAAILHGAVAVPTSAAARRWTLVAAVLGSGMAFVDGTVVNVALPAIQRDLQASAADAQWIIEAYALFLAALLLVGGALGDRYGRRTVFALGVAGFSIASLGCALASTVAALIAARALQGIGAALMVPGSLALISAAFPRAERGRAIGTWSAFSGITAAVGPVLGGFLVEHLAWPWAFLINLPIGALLLLIVLFKLPRDAPGPGRQPIDGAGAALVTVGLAALVFALIDAPQHGWDSPRVAGSAVLGVTLLLLFMRVEAHGAAPMLPLGLFRERNFSAANVLTLLLYAALGGGLYFFPLNLIQVQGYGATAAGAALLPFIVIMVVASRSAGKLVDRFGAKKPLVAGPLIAAIGFALFALPAVGGSYWTGFFPAVCVLGLGMAVTVAPLTTTVMNAVDSDLAGVASGVNNAVSRTGTLLAIAVFGIVLTAAFQAHLAEALARLQVPADLAAQLQAQRGMLAGMRVPDEVPAPLAAALQQEIGESFIAGFRRVMGWCAALALASALSAWCWIDGRPPTPAKEPIRG